MPENTTPADEGDTPAARLVTVLKAAAGFYAVADHDCHIPSGAPRREPDQDRLALVAAEVARALTEFPAEERGGLPIPVRRIVHGVEKAHRALTDRWGWGWVWLPDRADYIAGRRRAFHGEVEVPFLTACLSWRQDLDAERHDLAEAYAEKARAMGLTPTMTPEQGRAEAIRLHRELCWRPRYGDLPTPDGGPDGTHLLSCDGTELMPYHEAKGLLIALAEEANAGAAESPTVETAEVPSPQEDAPGLVASYGLVRLCGQGRPPEVCGQPVDPLPRGEYLVIKALVNAGANGLTAQQIKAELESGRQAIRRLRKKNPLWERAIENRPRRDGGGFRIVGDPPGSG